MKLALGYLFGLPLCVALAMWCGHAWTKEKWGGPGVQSMWAASLICLSAAEMAAVPVVVAMIRRSPSVGMAAFAGTALRLLVTGGLAVAYQGLRSEVHLPSFLTWLPILYIILLAAETLLAVVAVRRVLPAGGRAA